MFNKILTIAFILAIVTVFMYSNMAKTQYIVEKGLVSYWSFNKADIEGDTVKDVCGENDRTINGDPEIVEGKVGEALLFDGNDYVNYGVVDSSEGTVEAWIKQTGGLENINTILASGGKGQASYCHFRIFRNEKINFAQRSNDPEDWVTGSTIFSENTWYHVAVVSNGTSYKMYVNGQEEDIIVTNVANSGDWFGDTDNTDHIAMGVNKRGDMDDWFVGIIDEVCMYDRALSEDEINENMNAEGMAVVSSADNLALTWGEIKVSR